MSKSSFYLTPLILFKCIILDRTRHVEIYVFKVDSHVILVILKPLGKLIISQSSQAILKPSL